MSLFRKFVHQKIFNERGVTLVELLVAVGIFLAIILPLSSIYISGISLYDRTRIETDLQNETDFILSNILNTVQDASYFELPNDSFDPTRHNTLVAIFKNSLAGKSLLPPEDEGKSRDGLITYDLKLAYDTETKKQQSMLKRTFYQFPQLSSGDSQSNPNITNDSNNVWKTFKHDEGYVVGGLFTVTEHNDKLTIYLVVAPKGKSGTIRNGQKAEFTDLNDVLHELNRLQTERKSLASSDNEPLHFIRFVKTEFAVNNMKNG
ncbi:PilW family protein [Aneurinibacillus thermoaerophilus]|uniref:Prepilin-type N-terminal cleavage/methylation domain-containing protein n=1 Tax=Aneurinibacillus thermoaerophilus TaxID=143495 RepID=A0A1G7ZSH2_ANETH|nr:prepilin-type N-terminal cleavage/methylation domain-containing protein [Aneurinibacillus thermoaerophilus]MED0678903.1 prepilin-type N-terminal cleavage/methylation domain-containing protein [Aneurinibacillus thermoaerophilus]MED0736440.1 prepilin-type N-terminal cleavage/methylation domain-containing protein [Aneurinibacillus thermoaerophilus]MED0763103.1 prepilin-type N-terminal cleavage/methylation domain-containing protein [Aneurinibacillus thermoaerophilus]QYY42124.1 prepilin-type N-te